MARFLLVHGSSHGAWCWRDVIPALEALGHRVDAIDLPSHGDDPTPSNDVTLEDYAHAIVAHLDTPAIVVGHSMGGFPITRAAEIAPEQIARLVYLCAYTPWPGLSLSQMRMLGKTQPLLPAIRMAEDRKSFTFDPELSPAIFYQDCPPEALRFALSNLSPQPVQPNAVPVALTDRSQALPRSYILCEEDGAIPPELQARMADRFAPEDRYRLPCGHSPFFAMPERLAALLDTIAQG